MTPPILEREREFAILAAAAEDAADGTDSVVLAYGEPGIGKSSLVDGMRARCRTTPGSSSATATTSPRPAPCARSATSSTTWARRWLGRCRTPATAITS